MEMKRTAIVAVVVLMAASGLALAGNPGDEVTIIGGVMTTTGTECPQVEAQDGTVYTMVCQAPPCTEEPLQSEVEAMLQDCSAGDVFDIEGVIVARSRCMQPNTINIVSMTPARKLLVEVEVQGKQPPAEDAPLVQSTAADPADPAPGIDCGSDCEEEYHENVDAEFEAKEAPAGRTRKVRFIRYSGAVESESVVESVTMDDNKQVKATFISIHTLTVTKQGSGSGTVTAGAIIDCGSDCVEQELDYGTEVTLVATPDAGSTFEGWSGDASGANASVSVTMDDDKEVVAIFERACDCSNIDCYCCCQCNCCSDCGAE